jgi:hypothetical protein
MSTCTRENHINTLELPAVLEDLNGVISADLKVIVSALTERATERLMMSRGQSQQLRRTLWNNLTRVINESVETLDVERQ